MNSSLLPLVVDHETMVVLEIFPPPELFHHDHLILPHFRGDLEQLVLLSLLSQVDDIGPTLLIFGFEILEELVKALVLLSHLPDTLIQRLAFLSFVGLYERLQFLDFLDGPWPGEITLLSPFLFFVLKEQHLVLLVFVLIWILNHLFVHASVVQARA